jgi:hypothetical protein
MNASLITNNHFHPLLYYFELNKKEQRDFSEEQDGVFFRYRRIAYSLSDFMRSDYASHCPILGYYDGHCGHNYFASVWVKLSNSHDAVQVALLLT